MEMMVSLMIRTLNYNRKRTILTICTIILSVGMITAVLCGGWSMLSFCEIRKLSMAEIMRIAWICHLRIRRMN